jgi:hypothetical protein
MKLALMPDTTTPATGGRGSTQQPTVAQQQLQKGADAAGSEELKVFQRWVL